MINISKIIEEKSILIYFQVILSPMETHSISVESFVRGVNLDNGDIIPPNILFIEAAEEGLSNELDKLCIEQSFIRFKTISLINEKAMLYINVMLPFFQEALDSNFISKAAIAVGIPQRRIVIDLKNLSTHAEDISLIHEFIDYHRNEGFYISIDDIGKNYNNIDKIMLYNPDVIKINHQMLNSLVDKEYSVLLTKYIIDIAHKMGILVISTGVETEDDVITSLESGAQLIQGFYVSSTDNYLYEDIINIVNSFDRELVYNIINATCQDTAKNRIANIIRFTASIKSTSVDFTLATTLDYVATLFNRFKFIESGYLIDSNGIQVSISYINKVTFGKRNNELFGLYDIGTNHSDDEIYSRLQNPILTDWVTKPYRSKLSNEVSMTASFKMKTFQGDYVVVLNIDYNELTQYLSAKKAIGLIKS
jgi:EAL domain-containing protein (putative c-di-GMP-specific phosphodiesterase class I)